VEKTARRGDGERERTLEAFLGHFRFSGVSLEDPLAHPCRELGDGGSAREFLGPGQTSANSISGRRLHDDPLNVKDGWDLCQ
jgi:hypothetical protein